MRRSAARVVWVALWAAASLAAPASAEVPDLMSYQGVLTLPTGRSPEDGTYNLQFRIVDDLAGEHFLEALDVELRGGLYGVLLGGSGSTALSSAFAAGPRFLEIKILSAPPSEQGLVDAVLDLQPISPVPFALTAAQAEATLDPPDPVPTGMMILWDQPTGCGDVADICPCGWAEATEFRGRTARGADTEERWADLPDDPGVTMGAPTDTGMYGDTLSAAETPAHAHSSQAETALHSHSVTMDARLYSEPFFSGDRQINSDSKGWADVVTKASAPDGEHTHDTAATGGGAAHVHAARRVLFCRKQ